MQRIVHREELELILGSHSLQPVLSVVNSDSFSPRLSDNYTLH